MRIAHARPGVIRTYVPLEHDHSLMRPLSIEYDTSQTPRAQIPQIGIKHLSLDEIYEPEEKYKYIIRHGGRDAILGDKESEGNQS